MSGRISLTPEQHEAVFTRGRSLLVSAGAGSGKTRVLVERLLEYITDESAECDITDFLVVTYTRAAAAEMRARIVSEINARLARDPGNRHLRRQLMLCLRANISTIHSFCTDIVRENAHTLGLPPDFRVADEKESEMIKETAAEDVIGQWYDNMQEHPGFESLVSQLSEMRGDMKLVASVLDAHRRLQSHPEPGRWVGEQIQLLDLDGVEDVSVTPWGKVLLQDSRCTAESWHAIMSSALDDMTGYPEFLKAYGDSFETTIDGLKRFIDACDEGWDSARTCADIPFPTGQISGYQEFKDIRSRCRSEMRKLASRFECSSEELLRGMCDVKDAETAFLQLLLDFDSGFSVEKRRRRVVDFADLEHFALRILWDSENGMRTQAAEHISKRYREVLIDEYQDVNAVQELIFRAVSDDERNMFMVGDVKQSIYRFRLADPGIFLRKYESFPQYDRTSVMPDREPASIVLPHNFRSREGILNAVNFVFGNIMSRELGEMPYGELEALYPGAEFPDNGEPCVELDILDVDSGDDDTPAADRVEAEAQFAATRIRELVEGGMLVSNGHGGLRRLVYSDVAILIRSAKSGAWKFAAALSARGIPVSATGGTGFFESTEISVMTALIAVIDNPMQDIPLISVLRSPLYGFTADELARIRMCGRGDMYSALIAASESSEKCAAFLEELDSLREQSCYMKADEFLWYLYDRTGIMRVVSAMSGHDERERNLIRLARLAEESEATGRPGVFGFASFLERMMERGDEPERGDSSAPSGVQIMSIHKSKGLEFPVVFLADLTHRFNKNDLSNPILFHEHLGIGLKYRDVRRRIEYPTLARMAVSARRLNEMLSEEMRVLYVAMTRASEKLIMLASFRSAEKEILKLAGDSSLPVEPTVLSTSQNMAAWILLPALCRQEAAGLEIEGLRSDTGAAGQFKWKMQRRVTGAGSSRAPETRSSASVPDQIDSDEVARFESRIKEIAAFEYPYATSQGLPSKLTATQLKGRAMDAEVREEAGELLPAFGRSETRIPDFLHKKRRLTAAERGTALHLVMQYIDLAACADSADIRGEIDRLTRLEHLTEEQAGSVSIDRILQFSRTDIYKRMLAAERIVREFKFSLLMTSNDLGLGEAAENILFQGVVDCCFEESGRLVIIDFKTDRVSTETQAERAEIYRPQLNSYSLAMQRITGLEVKERLVYFFETGDTISV